VRVLIASDTADVRNGGACVQLWNLKRLLEGAGHEVRVFSFDGDAHDDGAWRSVNEPRTLPGRKFTKLTFYLPGYRALRQLVQDFQPDLVHVNSNFRYPATMLWALRDRKVIASARDYVWVCPTGWAVYQDSLEPCGGGVGLKCARHRCKSVPELALFQVPLSLVRDSLARRIVARFLSPSRRLAETMREHGFRAEVLRNPVAADARGGARNPGPRDPVILYVGALEEKKGVQVLFEAFTAAVAERPDLRLELAGKGSLLEPLRATAARNGLADRVRFHGHVEREDMPQLYRRATALVCPSLWMENFPNVVYEAMAHDCPVIGSDRGGIAELLADGRGLLYPAKNAGALAARLTQVAAGDPGVSARVVRARTFIQTELSEDLFLADYLRHAAEVTGAPPDTSGEPTPEEEAAAESGRPGRIAAGEAAATAEPVDTGTVR